MVISDNIEIISKWFLQQCDGDWEHEHGIKIETLDNPGWYITIDLQFTSLESLVIEEKADNSDDDWYFLEINNNQFKAAGDPMKLNLILNKFVEIIRNHQRNN
jgi:hypothetical protein